MVRVRKRKTRIRKKKGAYFFPNLITTMGLFCGFLSLIFILEKNFFFASILIFGAALFDTLDGRAARISDSVTKFGKEYDSLADIISFGVAAGMLAYSWALKPAGRFGWLAAFLYVACTALRLARFNARDDPDKELFFFGLPSPVAAGFIASYYLFSRELVLAESITAPSLLFFVVILALLMVSNIRYRSLKEFSFMRKHPFNSLVLSVFILTMIAYNPSLMLFVFISIYILSGPFYNLYLSRIERKTRSVQDQMIKITGLRHNPEASSGDGK